MEKTSTIVPRYERRIPEVNEAVIATYALLFSLAASGQIKLHKIDGWQKIGAVLNQRTAVAA